MSKYALGALRGLALLLLLIAAPVRAADGDGGYSIALLPGAPPVTMHKLWTPLVERLANDTGQRFRLKLYTTMAEFERDIWAGSPDFIFSSPIQAVVAHQSAGYVPLVRNSKLVGIGLFVREDSRIRTIDDLIGRKIAFVGNKNMCSVYIQHQLAGYKRKLDFEKEYAGSTRNVIINVLLGKSDAGAVFHPEMDREADETRRQLREVVATPDFAPHPVSAHPRVPATVRNAVRNAILSIANSADADSVLKPIGMPDPVAADYDRDYRALEAIDIKGLTNWGQ